MSPALLGSAGHWPFLWPPGTAGCQWVQGTWPRPSLFQRGAGLGQGWTDLASWEQEVEAMRGRKKLGTGNSLPGRSAGPALSTGNQRFISSHRMCRADLLPHQCALWEEKDPPGEASWCVDTLHLDSITNAVGRPGLLRRPGLGWAAGVLSLCGAHSAHSPNPSWA